MRISDWSSYLFSSDLQPPAFAKLVPRPKWPQVRECPCLAEFRVVGRCKFKRAERADMVEVPFAAVVPPHAGQDLTRSEARRLAKERASTCTSRGPPDHHNKKPPQPPPTPPTPP